MPQRVVVMKKYGPMELYTPKRRPHCSRRKGLRRCGAVCIKKTRKCSIKRYHGSLYRPIVSRRILGEQRICHGTQACRNKDGDIYCIPKGRTCGGLRMLLGGTRGDPMCGSGSQLCSGGKLGSYCIKKTYTCHGKRRARKVGPRAVPKECRGDTELCGRSCIPYYRACHIPPHVRPARPRRASSRYPTLASLGLPALPKLF